MKTCSLVAAVALNLLKVLPTQAGNNLTITSGADTNITAGPAFTTTDDGALLQPDTITSLWSLGHVSIATGTGGANTELGSISIEEALFAATDFDLSITATRNLSIAADGLNSGGLGKLLLTAGNDLTASGSLLTVGGTISLTSTAGMVDSSTVALFTNEFLGTVTAGNISIQAGGDIHAAELYAFSNAGGNGGEVVLSAAGSVLVSSPTIGGVDVSAFGLTGDAGFIIIESTGSGLTAGIGITSDLFATSAAGHGGAITLTSASGAISVVGSIFSSSGGDFTAGFHSGNITLTATTGDVDVAGATIGTSGGLTGAAFAHAGNISIQAGGDIHAAELYAFSGFGGDGGEVVLSAAGSVVVSSPSFGGVDVSAFGLTGDAGFIIIESTGSGLTGGIEIASDLFAFSAAGNGGAITLTAAGGAGITVSRSIFSSSDGDSAAGFHSGNITLTATAGDVDTSTATIGTSGGLLGYASANAGNISIQAGGGIRAAELYAFSNSGGNGGEVVLSAAGAVLVSSPSFGGVDVSAFGLTGNAGFIIIESTGTGWTGGIDSASDLFATSAAGHGGAVALAAAGGAGILVSRTIDTKGALSAGDITLTATGGAVQVTGTGLSTGGITFAGNGGDITIEASGAITTGAMTHLWAASATGDGGAAVLHSSGAGIAVSYLDTSTWNGFGNAGTVTLTADGTGATGLQIVTLRAFSNEGDGGTTTLTSHGTAGITVTSIVDTRSYGRRGGDIILTATAGPVNISGQGLNTAVLGSPAPAGNITIEAVGAITASNIEAGSAGYTTSSSGGAVLLHSSGAGIEVVYVSAGNGGDGNGGSVTLDAAGGGSTGLTVRGASAGALYGLGGAVNLIANGSAGITVGDSDAGSYRQSGGDITITSTAGPVTMANSYYGIYTASSDHPTASGSAGKITITSAGAVTTPANRALVASSTYGHGGNVSVTSRDAAGINIGGTINTKGLLSSGDITLDAPVVSVAKIITGNSAIEISAQEVTLGDVQADGTLHIAPQAGFTSMTLEITGDITGGVQLDFDFGSAGLFTVASGASLGGSGTIGGDTTILGTLAPGNSPGTLTFTGDLDIAAAEEFIFELGVPASDQVILTAGQLSIGSLGLDDFTFAQAAGFASGEYVLFDTNDAILGALDPGQFSGTVFGYAAELKLTDGGRDVTLAIAPEPAGGALLASGVGLLFGGTRRRRAGILS